MVTNRRHPALLAALTLILVPAALAGDAPDDVPAKEAVHRFMRAFRSTKIDELMATVDVPWFHNSKKLIRDRDELKQEFEQLFERDPDRDTISFIIARAATYRTIRGQVNAAERKLLDEVLGPDDWVVLIVIHREDKARKERRRESVAILVRVRAGQTAVVGLRS
jgi:hypothetical protein